MKISQNEWGLLLVGGAILGVFVYLAYDNVENKTMPRQEVASVGGFSAALDACTEQEFFRPHLLTENQQLQFTPHRYPNVTGGGFSTIIHYGMSQLRLPAPQDRMWIERPPAEVQWLCLVIFQNG
jgi:hypothetical protein